MNNLSKCGILFLELGVDNKSQYQYPFNVNIYIKKKNNNNIGDTCYL